MTDKSTLETTGALVDRFIEETWGICDPAPYRQAMSEHFGKAIEWAVAKERQRCARIADNYGHEDDRLSKDFACEVADEIAARIRCADGYGA